MILQWADGASVIRGWRQFEDYSLSSVQNGIPFGEDATLEAITNDLNYSVRTTEGVHRYSDVVVYNGPDSPAVQLTTLTPGVCLVAQDGTITRVSDGTCTIEASGITGKRQISLAQVTEGGWVQYTPIPGDYVAGSLRKYLLDQQVAALSGIIPGAASQRAHVLGNNYDTSPFPGQVWHWGGTYGSVNTNNFLRAQSKPGFDALPLDALDQILAGGQDGSIEWKAWISNHHYLTWKGHGVSDGTYHKQIRGEIVVQYSPTEWTGTLVKLLPSNWEDYLPGVLPGGTLNEIRCWARLYNTYDGKTDATSERRWVQPVVGLSSPRIDGDLAAYQKRNSNNLMVTGGDSGTPVFCGINGDLVMLTHTVFGGYIGWYFYAEWATQINTAMNALATQFSDPAAGTYAIQTVDLSGFTDYS